MSKNVKKMYIWEQWCTFESKMLILWQFGMFSKIWSFFKQKCEKCTFESNDVHLRAMMYIWEQNFHFVANLACFWKFEVFFKMLKNVKHVHWGAMMYIWEQNVHFVANLMLFWKFEVLKKNVKKCQKNVRTIDRKW